MGAPSTGWRTLAAFFGVASGVALLFALVALVALQPRDGLAWVQVPDLAADLRVDSGLQTKPLKGTVVAAVLQDQALDGTSASGLAVAPALAVAPQQPTVAINVPPTSRPDTASDSQPGPQLATHAYAGCDSKPISDPDPNAQPDAGPNVHADPDSHADSHALTDPRAEIRDHLGRRAGHQVKERPGGPLLADHGHGRGWLHHKRRRWHHLLPVGARRQPGQPDERRLGDGLRGGRR